MPAPSRSVAVAYAMVVTAALCFVVNAGVSRVVLRAGVDPATLTTLRVTASVVVLATWAVLRRPTVLRLPRGRPMLLLVALGLVGVAALQWTYFTAVDRIPVGLALLLQYTAPVLVALWVRLVRREPVRRRVWAALALSLAGLALVARLWAGLSVDGLGVVAGLGAAVCFATYFLLGEAGVERQDPLAVVLWSFLVAAVAMNLVRPVTGLDADVVAAETSLLGALAEWTAPGWLLLAWIVLLGTVVPFGLELRALQTLPATAVVVVAMLEPVGATVIGWAWLGESLSAVQVLGACAVVAGIALAQTARPQVRAEPPPPG